MCTDTLFCSALPTMTDTGTQYAAATSHCPLETGTMFPFAAPSLSLKTTSTPHSPCVTMKRNYKVRTPVSGTACVSLKCTCLQWIPPVHRMTACLLTQQKLTECVTSAALQTFKHAPINAAMITHCILLGQTKGMRWSL